MGGVDLFDMLMHSYKLPSLAKRYPIPMISFLLDLALVSAFLLHRADMGEDDDNEECSSKLFRLQVVEALASSKPKKKVGRPTLEESSRT